MTEPVKEGPSNRALRQLNNRNNLAGLKLKKTLEQFDREKSFNISILDRDRFDTRDFLKNVKYCDSDYLPQSRNFLGSPSQRRRSHTAKTAPCRLNHRDHLTTTDGSDDDIADEVTDSENYDVTNQRPVTQGVSSTGSRLLGSRKTDQSNRFRLTEYQRAERFLRRLREQVAMEELQSHYTDEDYKQFITAVISKISRCITPSVRTPSATQPRGPTVCPALRQSLHAANNDNAAYNANAVRASFTNVYPIKLLADIETRHAAILERSPSPSLGTGSPGIRATPLGLPEGGSVGTKSRLIFPDQTGSQSHSSQLPPPLHPAISSNKPCTPYLFSMDLARSKTQEEINAAMMMSLLRSGPVRRRPLDQRVNDFCKELDEIRIKNGSLPLPVSKSADFEGRERRTSIFNGWKSKG